jgi:sugar lactone lactonase YvrE
MKLIQLGLLSTLTAGVLFANNIVADAPGQFPEGVEYNKKTGEFYLGSLSAKNIIKIDKDSKVSAFSTQAPLPSAGLHIDYDRNELLATGLNRAEVSDNDPSTHGNASLVIYDLTSGELKANIDLRDLNPNQEAYFANDITSDKNGNIYVSDFKAGAVYKVDKNNTPSLFYKGDKLGLANGLEIVNDNTLLVSDSVPRDGKWQIVKIPLDNPKAASRVIMDDPVYRGFDGMLVNEDGTVVGVTHNTDKSASILIKLQTSDNWNSAKIVSSQVSKTRLTTVARVQDGNYFALQQNFKNPKKADWVLENIKLP